MKTVKKRKTGQVVVEMLLILPVFLTIVFTVMEMGYLAYWVIVLNHATYECARIGSMLATPLTGGEPAAVDLAMQNFMHRMISGAAIAGSIESTLPDPQAGTLNHDLVATASFNVPLIFPTSYFILAKPPGSGRRLITATVRLPIERPLPR